MTPIDVSHLIDRTPSDAAVAQADGPLSGAIDGASFALDAPDHVEAVWGEDHAVLWARGEPFMSAGPDGVGKTTIAQQLALRMCGLRAPVLLGLPVAVPDGKVLYVAADRPQQAARSMRRMVTEDDRDVLAERLVVWKGALPFDLVKTPGDLAAWIESIGATVAFFDCLKDLAGPLKSEEVGQAVNDAMQRCVLAGIEVCELHHQRKAQAENKRPRKLADVYGSRWLTAGCGSVVMLWGEAGDPVVELTHLKQPADVVGPFTLLHDNRQGTTIVKDAADVVAIVGGAADQTATVKDVAAALFHASEPTPNQVEKARRRLEAEERLERLPSEPGEPVLYRLREGGHAEGHAGSRDGLTGEGHAALHKERRDPRGTIPVTGAHATATESGPPELPLTAESTLARVHELAEAGDPPDVIAPLVGLELPAVEAILAGAGLNGGGEWS